MSDHNRAIIDEFRSNGGRVGGFFEGRPLLLLRHTGARTGTKRVNPLAYLALDTGYAVFASKGGAATNPDWYHNLLAHPETTIEIGDREIEVKARDAQGAERDEIWERQKREFPGFAGYEAKAKGRRIPVIILEPR